MKLIPIALLALFLSACVPGNFGPIPGNPDSPDTSAPAGGDSPAGGDQGGDDGQRSLFLKLPL